MHLHSVSSRNEKADAQHEGGGGAIDFHQGRSTFSHGLTNFSCNLVHLVNGPSFWGQARKSGGLEYWEIAQRLSFGSVPCGPSFLSPTHLSRPSTSGWISTVAKCSSARPINFTVVNKIELIRATLEVMYDRPGVNVKVQQVSTFAFTLDLRYIASISFTPVKFMYVSSLKLRNSGNPP